MALQAMRVPTVFTAKDRFSNVVSAMTKNTRTFSAGMDRMNNRINNSFNSMNRVSQFAITAGLGSLFYKAGNDIIAYEKQVASLGAVTGTVVGSMNQDIESLGFQTNRSVIDVAKSFENIGSKMSEYLKNPTALREIAKQSILMADASRMGLDESTDNLTSILNQFKLSYKDASRVVNKLSSGEDVGASTISESSDVVRQFASSARMAGADLEETIALVQSTTKTLGKDGVGRGFRNLMVDLNTGKGMDKNKQRALKMVGADINKIINPSTKFIEKLREIKKLLSNKQAMGMFFKKTGFETGATFLGSFKMFEDYLKSIRENDTAIVKATKNNQTFAKSWIDLKNTFTNYMVTGEKTNTGLKTLQSIMLMAKDNMGGLINTTLLMITAFAGFKVFLVGAKLVNGIVIGMRAYRIATLLAARAQMSFVGAIIAGVAPASGLILPILGIVAALGLLGFVIYKVVNRHKTAADEQVEAITKVNKSISNSTTHLQNELQKQLDNRLSHLNKIKQLGNIPLTPEAQKHNDIIDAEKNRIAMENYNAIKKAVADRKNNASSELASFNHPNDMARSMFMQGFMNSQLGRLPKEANVDLLQSQGMSFAEIEKLYPQLVTPQERKNQLEIIINDKGGKVEGVKLDGRPYALESPVYTSSTTGVKD